MRAASRHRSKEKDREFIMLNLVLAGEWLVTRDTILGGSVDRRYLAPEELTRNWIIQMLDMIPEEHTFELPRAGGGLTVKEHSAKFVATQTVTWREPTHPLPGPDQNTTPIVGLLIPHASAHELPRQQPMLVMIQTTPDLYTISWVGRATSVRPPLAEGLPAQIVRVDGIYFDADGVQSNFKMERIR